MEFLIVIEPASGGRYEHRVAPGSYVLGREEASCDIAILSPEVSRQHARIHLTAESCSVEDLGSTAGTMKDGHAIDGKQSYSFPVEISLGTTRLTVSVNEVVEMSFDSAAQGAATVSPGSAVTFNQGPKESPATASAVGHFTKGREIARGGMGAILEANDRLLGRTVAMKVVLENRASEDARMRFIREATVLGQLEHPNIIPIHELGKDDDANLFYTMKMVEGRTLQAIINDLKKGDSSTIEHYTLDRLLTAFAKVCDAMAFAHSKGIIHRDLKPENVMVGAFGEVLVMDWGLAKILKDVAQTADELEQRQALVSPVDEASESALPTGFQELTDSQMHGSSEDLTMDGAVMGSPQYMPPEQAEGRVADIDERTDIYSLGGILYAILTLRPPIKGKSVVQVLVNVKSGNITPPTEYNPGGSEAKQQTAKNVKDPGTATALPHCPGGKVPTALSAVTMKAMAPKASARYLSVSRLTGEIDSFQHGHATTAEDISRMGELFLLIKRNKGISVAAAISVCLIALLTGGFLSKVLTEKQKAVEAGEQAYQEKTNALHQAKIAKLATTNALQNLARSRLTQADQAYQGKNWPETRRHLDELGVPPDDMKPDRDYLARELDQSLKPKQAYPIAVWKVAPDPSRPGVFAMPSQNGFLEFIHLETGERLGRLNGCGPYKTPAVSPDGSHLVLLDQNGVNISVYETANMQLLKKFRHEGKGIKAFSFNADGKRFVLARSKSVTAYDLSGNQVWRWDGTVQAAYANHMGHPLVVANEEAIWLLDPATGRVKKQLPASAHRVWSVCLSPDGSRLVYTDAMGGCFGLDVKNGKRHFASILGRRVSIDLEFLPDNEFFVAAFTLPGQEDTYYVEAFSATTGTWVRTFSGGVSKPRNLAVHPRTGHIAASGDQANGWGPGVLKALVAEKTDPQSTMPANAWGFLDEMHMLFRTNFQGKVGLLSLNTFKTTDPNVLFPSRDVEDAFHFDLSRDRSHLLAIRRGRNKADGTVARVYRQTDGRWNLKTEIPFPWIAGQNPHLLRLAPDGSAFLAASLNFSRIYRFADDTKPIDIQHDHNRCHMTDVFWLGRGKTLLGAHYGKDARGRVGATEFLRRWDAGTGAPTKTDNYPTPIQALAMEPGETRFAEAGHGREIRIRNAADLRVTREFRAHDAPIVALAWHPKLPILASVSLDRSIRFWNVDTGDLVDQLYGIAADPTAMKFSPKGNWIAVSTGGPEHLLRVWECSKLGSGPSLLRRTSFLKQKTEEVETVKVRTPKLFNEDAAKDVMERLVRGEAVDLVPYIKDPGSGPWRVKDGALESNPFARLPRLLLPVRLHRMKDYEIRIRLQAIAPKEVFTVSVPLGQTLASYVINGYAWADYSSGLRVLDGQFKPEGEYARTGKLIRDEELHELLLRVQRQDDSDQVQISVDLDGENLMDWTGESSRLTPPEGFKDEDPGRLLIACYKQAWRVESIKVKATPQP